VNYYQYTTDINLIYPTGETVDDGNKLKYYSNQLSSIHIHFNNIYNNSYDFKCGLVCEIRDSAVHVYVRRIQTS